MRELTKNLWIPLGCSVAVALSVGCVGDDDPLGASYDAATPSADADPNAPDAAPGGDTPDAGDNGGGPPDAGDPGGDNAGVACGDTMTCTGDDVCCVSIGGGSASCASPGPGTSRARPPAGGARGAHAASPR